MADRVTAGKIIRMHLDGRLTVDEAIAQLESTGHGELAIGVLQDLEGRSTFGEHEHIYEFGTGWCVECMRWPSGRQATADEIREKAVQRTEARLRRRGQEASRHINLARSGRGWRPSAAAQIADGIIEGGGRRPRRLFPDRHPRVHRMIRWFRPYARRQLRLALERL